MQGLSETKNLERPGYKDLLGPLLRATWNGGRTQRLARRALNRLMQSDKASGIIQASCKARLGPWDWIVATLLFHFFSSIVDSDFWLIL